MPWEFTITRLLELTGSRASGLTSIMMFLQALCPNNKKEIINMDKMISTTEQTSNYDSLEKMSTKELLVNMNNEDKKVPQAVEKAIPQIVKLVDVVVEKMKEGGRLFYIGA